MKRLIMVALTIAAGFMLTGCASSMIGSNPKQITFQDAMTQVSEGLNKMYDIGKDHPKSGLTPTEITIEFNISADASADGKLNLAAAPTVAGMVQPASVSGGVDIGDKASRSNKITIKFTNLFVSPTKDALIRAKSPAEIKELLKVLDESGYNPVYRLNSSVK